MRIRKVVTLNQASPGAEEVQWTWKRESLQMRKTYAVLYSRRVIIEEITEELKLIGEGVYQELVNSCFGFLMRFDTQGAPCNDALHSLFTREVIKADAGPDELWYRVGGRFIRFSKYEYALVTGLSFRPSTFDPSAEHHPPETGLFFRHYGGRNLTMGALRSDFMAGAFRESPADALKVAKLLIVYFLLFGLDGTKKYIDEWAWTLIEDTDQWETFMWGKYSYQILLTYLERVPTVLRYSRTPSYRVYGFVWAFLIWAFEAIPALRIACRVNASNDVIPRCLRWRLPNMNRVDMEGLCDRQMEVYSMLEPSAEEQRQPYWEHITDDLRSNVCYIHQDNRMKKKTTPVNPPSRNVLPVSRRRRFKAFYNRISHSKKKRKRTDQEKAPDSRPQHSCHTSAAPMIRKRKRTDPLTTRGSPDLSEHECGRQNEMTIQEEFFSQRPELSNVAVGQAGRDISVFKLMDKINELKNKNMENERLIVKMSQEIEELRQEKLEGGLVVKELEHENLKANKIIDELRLEKTESDKVAGLYKSKLEKLSPQIEDVGDLDFPNDADNLDSPSLGVRLTNNSSGLSRKGDRKLAESCWTREDDAHKTFVTSSGSQSGAHASGTWLMSDKKNSENLKMPNEKNNLFSVEELRDLNLENEQLVKIYKKKCKGLDIKIVKMGQEVDDENLAYIKTVEELRFKNIEANKTIDELRLKISESDKLADVYKSKLDKAADMLTTKVGDFANLFNEVRELTEFATLEDAENVVMKSSGSKNSGLSKKGAHASIGTRLMCGEGCFSKIARSSSTSAGGDTEILDSDDDESISDSRMNDIKKNSQMKCDELAKTVTLLMEEKNQRDKKIIELENKNAESERLVGVYFEKCESLDIEIVKMGKEIEGLRSDNVEATKTMEELRLKILESDQVAEGYKNRIDMLSPRMAKIGKDLSDMLNANSRKGSCCSGGRSRGLSMRGMKGKGWGVQMCSGRFSKIEQPSSAAAADGDIIEISDEEELNPDGAADVANVGESEMNIVQSSLLGQRRKRNRKDVDNLIVCSTATKKRNVGARDEDNDKENQVLESSEDRIDCSSSRKCVGEEAGQASDYQTFPGIFDGLNDSSVSTDSEDSCSDSRIDNLIASLGVKK